MNQLMQDARFALRQLRKAPVFALTAVVTLALGIGANTAIFTIFHQVLLRMLPVRSPGELVQLSFTGTDSGHAHIFGGTDHDFFSYPMYRNLRDHDTALAGLIADDEVQAGIVWKNQPEVTDAELVSGNYFDVLGVNPAAGRLLLPSDDVVKEGSPVVVLSYNYWKTRFAASDSVINQSILINGHPFVIVGVAARDFSSAISGFTPKVFFPMMMKPQVDPGGDSLDDPRSQWLTMVGRLKPGTTAAATSLALTAEWRALRAEELKAHPMGDARFRERFVEKSSIVLSNDAKGFSPLRDQLRMPLLILMAMVLLLAAMTCVNMISLLLVRAAARAREFAVRYALGAARSRIVRQLLLEGLLLGCIGGALGLCLAPASATLLVRMISGTNPGAELPYSVNPNASVLGFTIGLSVLISMLFSLAPIWQQMKPELNETLRQQSASTHGAMQAIRKSATAVQIGLSILLLSGAGMFLKTLQNLTSQKMGLATDHVVTFTLDPSLAGYANGDAQALQVRVREALKALPGVQSVGGTTDWMFVGGGTGGNITVPGYTQKNDQDMDVETPTITPGYFSSLRVPLLLGRDIAESDVAGAASVAVINESMAKKYFGSPQQAMDKFIGSGGGKAVKLDIRIVGVVGDSKQRTVRDDVVPTMYRPFAQNPRGYYLNYFVRTAQAPESVENSIRAGLRGVDSKLISDAMKTLDQQVADNISNERVIALLSACFAFLALLTTAVGLYGVLAYATAQRTREIGIRMALGAQRLAVVRLVLREIVLVAAFGIGAALPVAVLLSRFMRSQLFGVSPFDPMVMLACVAVTLLMVVMASAIPARRAASVEPTKALRTD
ncbi:MAG TPA: ABC transporter permease [Acidobacteriaceae bacterium]|jgi:predicted permease